MEMELRARGGAGLWRINKALGVTVGVTPWRLRTGMGPRRADIILRRPHLKGEDNMSLGRRAQEVQEDD